MTKSELELLYASCRQFIRQEICDIADKYNGNRTWNRAKLEEELMHNLNGGMPLDQLTFREFLRRFDVDLSGYYTKSEVDELIGSELGGMTSPDITVEETGGASLGNGAMVLTGLTANGHELTAQTGFLKYPTSPDITVEETGGASLGNGAMVLTGLTANGHELTAQTGFLKYPTSSDITVEETGGASLGNGAMVLTGLTANGHELTAQTGFLKYPTSSLTITDSQSGNVVSGLKANGHTVTVTRTKAVTGVSRSSGTASTVLNGDNVITGASIDGNGNLVLTEGALSIEVPDEVSVPEISVETTGPTPNNVVTGISVDTGHPNKHRLIVNKGFINPTGVDSVTDDSVEKVSTEEISDYIPVETGSVPAINFTTRDPGKVVGTGGDHFLETRQVIFLPYTSADGDVEEKLPSYSSFSKLKKFLLTHAGVTQNDSKSVCPKLWEVTITNTTNTDVSIITFGEQWTMSYSFTGNFAISNYKATLFKMLVESDTIIKTDLYKGVQFTNTTGGNSDNEKLSCTTSFGSSNNITISIPAGSSKTFRAYLIHTFPDYPVNTTTVRNVSIGYSAFSNFSIVSAERVPAVGHPAPVKFLVGADCTYIQYASGNNLTPPYSWLKITASGIEMQYKNSSSSDAYRLTMGSDGIKAYKGSTSNSII